MCVGVAVNCVANKQGQTGIVPRKVLIYNKDPVNASQAMVRYEQYFARIH